MGWGQGIAWDGAGEGESCVAGILKVVANPVTTHDVGAVAADGAAAARRHTLVSDYVALMKVRVSTMVVITAGAGYYLGALRSGISPWQMGMVQALGGIAVVTCGAGALNQALERKTDGRMRRTADRPMAAGRIGLAHGLALGFAAIIAGSVWLALATNMITGTLTLLTALGYVGIYTPLKRMTTLNTFVGAFPGALPPLVGWTAARGMIEWPAVALFAILFVWQFPHFMAIGWMYREDYARAGIRVTAVGDKNGSASVVQALFYAVVMIPVSVWPYWLGMTGRVYGVAAVLLGVGYLWYTVRFAGIVRTQNASVSRGLARDLLKASVIYLPLLLAAMMLNAAGKIGY